MHIEQFIAIVTGAIARAVMPVDCPTVEHVIVMVDLEDTPFIGGAAQHSIGAAHNRNRRVGRTMAFGDQGLEIVTVAQIDRVARLDRIQRLLNRIKRICARTAIAVASPGWRHIPVRGRLGRQCDVQQRACHQCSTNQQYSCPLRNRVNFHFTDLHGRAKLKM